MFHTVLKKTLWRDRLHTTIQILACLPEELKLNRLLEITDKMHENNGLENDVYATIAITDKQDILSQVEKI